MIQFSPAVRPFRFLSPVALTASSLTVALLCCCRLVAVWLTLCGTSPQSLLALQTGLLLGFVLTLSMRPLTRPAAAISAFTLAAALFGSTMLATFAMPPILPEILNVAAESFRGSSFISGFFAFLLPAAVVAIATVPIAAWLQFTMAELGTQYRTSGIALGGLLTATCSVLSVNPETAAASSGLLALTLIFFSATGTATSVSTATLPLQSVLQLLSTTVVTGIAIVSALRSSHVFAQLSLPLLCTTAALALSLLTAFSQFLSFAPGMRLLLKLVAPAVLLLAPLSFSGLVRLNIIYTATTGLNWLVHFELAILLSIAAIPLAIALTSCQRHPSQQTTLLIACGITGGAFIALISSLLCPATIQLQIAATLLASLTLFTRPEGSFTKVAAVELRPRPFPRMHLAVITVTVVLATTLGSPQTASLSRLMFSERTRMALQHNVAPELISQSAPGRLVETRVTSVGEVAVWKLGGNIIEFRRNGISQGAVSSSPDTTPQPPEDVLPLILAICNHPQPGQVMLLGDDSGAALRSSTHFPVQQILAVRQDSQLTQLAAAHVWNNSPQKPTDDTRVRIEHKPIELAVRSARPQSLDVVVCTGPPASAASTASLYNKEFYTAVRAALSADGVFAQRFRGRDLGPEPLRECLATLSSVFPASGAIQTVPGEIILLAGTSEKGLISPGLLDRLQKEHVRTELMLSGWDWAQVAVLPLADAADPIGLFSRETRPLPLSAAAAQTTLNWPAEAARIADKAEELRLAFAPWQKQLASALPVTEAHHEAKRRLSSLAQQIEILAGMPDQPWTYRRSLRMEMQQHPRPPLEKVENGRIIRVSHPLDEERQQYFRTLGAALMAAASDQQAALELVRRLVRFARSGDPLMGHFSHYEIVRLHELLNHPAPAEELQHRLHIVFFAAASDASVRPVITALDQLVRQPELVQQPSERFDQLNGLLQKLIERWEARTAWEPKSAVRVQNDVDQSVRISNLALDQMQELAGQIGVSNSDFLYRRRYINEALIVPLRDYRDQVLAHRMKTQPLSSDGEDPDDQPLLIPATQSLNTN